MPEELKQCMSLNNFENSNKEDLLDEVVHNLCMFAKHKGSRKVNVEVDKSFRDEDNLFFKLIMPKFKNYEKSFKNSKVEIRYEICNH